MVKAFVNGERKSQAGTGITLWAKRSGLAFALLGLPFSIYFGGYPGFLFFKSFRWFPFDLVVRAYFGAALGILVSIFLFWAFGTVTGAFIWWLFNRKTERTTAL
jgi:hypothetical protein